jgi:hypothetical protein
VPSGSTILTRLWCLEDHAAADRGAIDVLDKRQSIYVDGFAHRNPVPAACRIGNLVYSGGIHGLDPATGVAADRKSVV